MEPEDRPDAGSNVAGSLPPPPPAPTSTLAEPTRSPRPRLAIGAALVAVAVVIAVIASMVIGGPGGRGATALALSFQQGQTQRAHMTMDMKATVETAGRSQPIDVSMSTDVEWRTTGVDASGTATIEETFSNPHVGVNGSTTTTTLPSITLRITRDGSVVSSSGSVIASGMSGGPTQLGADNLSAILPDAVVSPGDTWTKTVDPTIFGQTIHYTASGRYLRDEQMGGVDAAVVETTSSIPVDLTLKVADVAAAMGLPATGLPPEASLTYAGHVTTSATSWIDASAKRLLKTEATSRYSMAVKVKGFPANPLPSNGLTMSGTISLSLTFT
jgi:hypothetical protein